MSSNKEKVVDLLSRQLQKSWSGSEAATEWIDRSSMESLKSVREPVLFHLIEPLVTGRSCCAVIELDKVKELASIVREELTVSHQELGEVAGSLALDLLWERSTQHKLANMSVVGNLANFCLMETGQRLLSEKVPDGLFLITGMIFYAKKRFSDEGDVVARPFGGVTPEPLVEDDVLAFSSEYVAFDARNHPELKKRFPLNKFLKKFR